MARSLAACTLALVLALAAACRTEAVKPIGDYTSGILTFYGGKQDGMDPSSPSFGTKVGSCGFGTIPKDAFPYFSVAGISPNNALFKAGPIDACGQCIQIECIDKRSGACKTDSAGKPLSILVMVADKCPECEADHIDVQAMAFAKISVPSLGKVDMRYRRVECVVPTDMQVSVMNFDGGGKWLSLTVTDTGGRGAVKSVSVKGSGGSGWMEMKNTYGAAWELSAAPTAPLDFKFVCDDNAEVTALGVVKQNGGISGGAASPVKFSTGEQFKITDPAAQQVKAFEGGSDPMLVTSSTPGNGDAASSSSSTNSSSSSSSSNSTASSSSSTSSSSGGGSGGCNDVAPPGSYSCAQQKEFGKCGESFMTQGSYCASTCGRCGSGSSGNKQGSTSAGRKLLAGGAAARRR